MKISTDERFQTLNSKWQSVVHTDLMWPGEYQNAVDTCGNPHNPWGVDLTYFECCTGTPYADDRRASAFVSTDISPTNIAREMGKSVLLQGVTLRVQEVGGDDVHVKEGDSILFSIHRQNDSGVGGTVCIITALSPGAAIVLVCQEAEFRLGAFTIVHHGRYKRTIQTKLGPKRLVHIVGINEGDTDSSKLTAIFTIEDDSAIAYQPRPANDHLTLADHVIARGVLAFHNGGLTSCISPTIEYIVVCRDYHGHGLARCLFGAIEEWFRHGWHLDTKTDARTLQATQLTHAIVDGVVMPGSEGGGGGGETGACRGLTAVTERQLLFENSGFNINRPRKGSYDAMMSEIYPKHFEGAKRYLPTKYRSQCLTDIALGWRSCDYCFDLEGDTDKLKVCTGCVCERYFAGRYCSTICQKKDRPRHKLSCGKTRAELNVDYLLFRLGGR